MIACKDLPMSKMMNLVRFRWQADFHCVYDSVAADASFLKLSGNLGQ
jgi:hypothetical protein